MLMSNFALNFADESEPISTFETVTSQPFLVSLLLVGGILFLVYSVLQSLGVRGLQRLLAIVPIMLILAVIYFQHGELIATVLLAGGFLLSFILAFAQMSGSK